MTKVTKAITKTPSRRSRANRANAQKSTGPKTARGKLITKHNATKHGLLSKEIFRENDNPEVRAEYEQLLSDLRVSFAPTDTIEEMLVERMAVAWWRLARVLRFEQRETRRAIRVGGKALPEPADGSAGGGDIFERLRRDPEQMARELHNGLTVLDACVAAAEERGHLTTFDLDALSTVPGDICVRCLAFIKLREEKEKDSEIKVVLAPRIYGTQPTPANNVAEMLAEEIQNFLRWQEVCYVALRNPELRSVLERPDLPDQVAADRILRYETTIERQFYRAMDQLERLQRRRGGEVIPAPARLHLSTEPN